VISGGAKGADQAGMLSAIAAEGKSVGVMANDLARNSTMKKYRDAIVSGQLVLISPYDPQARFQVGNAMGRNKLIYALADQALVIRSSYQSGGTWAGATEELKRDNACSVWVRITDQSSEGNKKLIEFGAKALFDEQVSQALFDPNFEYQYSLNQSSNNENYVTLSPPLENHQIPQVEVDSLESKESPLKADAETLFKAVIPFLLEHLKVPRKNQKEIASYFQLCPKQVSEWLNKMIEMKLVEKTKSGYCAISNSTYFEQLSLIDFRD
jgi:predicted Rossmann fold nucleotide-binding protein DprA/Smf involved in DNA uptake